MMKRPATAVWIGGIAAVLVCSGCGFKGPLYLPERNATVVTHPAKNKSKTSQQSPPSRSQPPASPPSAPPSPPQ